MRLTPPPGDVIGEGAAHKWAGDGGNSVHGSNDTSINWSLAQRNRIRNNDQSSREDTCAAQSCNSPAHNESRGRRSNSTDERANLEDTDCNQVDPFDRVEGVEFAEEQLERAGAEEVGGAVPADYSSVSICPGTKSYEGGVGEIIPSSNALK
jgi:hypothetical protein